MSNKTLCIYHGNCADGFGAAWAVRHALGDAVEFHAGVYQDPPPDVAGRDVIMVDFSYKRPVLTQMSMTANTILVLDHHKSAAEDLAGLPLPVGSDWGIRNVTAGYEPRTMRRHAEDNNGPPLYALFDMDRSGARIAWDFFHHRKTCPKLIEHIEDRDLWRFKLEGTREIQAAVFSYPYCFEVWDKLMARPLDELRLEGCSIERKHFKDIRELLKVTTRRFIIGGYNVPVANLPYTLTSDAGHILAENEHFAACYWDTPEGRTFSLRSVDGGLDVSDIAKQYGGGGHVHAAGFRVSHDATDPTPVA